MARTKRQYSREFPKGRKRVTIRADWVPEGLQRAVVKKAREEKVSVRSAICRQLADWTGWKNPEPPPAATP